MPNAIHNHAPKSKYDIERLGGTLIEEMAGFRMKDDDLQDLDWHKFPEGKEPQILTGLSEFCKDGKHAECVGHGEYKGQPIFCMCPCHEVPREA